jgi:hypothetical protein
MPKTENEDYKLAVNVGDPIEAPGIVMAYFFEDKSKTNK